MASIDKVSVTLGQLRNDLVKARDNEVSMASECLAQYVTDHNDRQAYKNIDHQVNQLAKAWDKMIAQLEKWEYAAQKIEDSCENFYGN